MNKKKQNTAENLLKPAEIQIEINQVGNIGEFNKNFFLEIEFLNKKVEPFKNEIFCPCSCGPTHNLNSFWKLKFATISEDEMLNISTNPIIVILKSFEKADINYDDLSQVQDIVLPQPQDIVMPQDIDEITTIGYFPLNISKMISYESITLSETQPINLKSKCIFGDVRTWPNTPFISYKITSLNPLLSYESTEAKPFENIMNFSITLECITNVEEEIIEKYSNFEAAFNFPLQNSFKTIQFQKGQTCMANKLNFYKFHSNLMSYKGDLKSSNIPINSSFRYDEFEIPEKECTLNETKILSDKIINFQQILEYKITRNMFERFLQLKSIPIEVLLSSDTDKQKLHLVGVIDLKKFKYVNIKHLRYIIPLMEYKPEFFQKFPNCIPIFAQLNKKMGDATAVKGKKSIILQQFEYVLNSKQLSTCIILDLKFDEPFLARKKNMFIKDNSIDFQINPTFDRELNDLNLKKSIYDYIEATSKNDIEHTNASLPSEGEFYSMIDKVAAANFSFQVQSKQEAHKLLEDLYIFLTNKIHDSINGVNNDLNNNPRYRLNCAIECFELGCHDDARDFYIMNINNGENVSNYYLDYAIHNLFISDMNLATICCNQALANNPKSYESLLILAYILFFLKDYNAAEEILLKILEMCDNFAEAWVALFVVYFSEERKSSINWTLKKIKRFYNAKNETYECHLHKRKELLWNTSINFIKDPQLIAIKFFIQLGCLQFAEVALSYIIHGYGCDSFEYLYHMALIDYYRNDYTSALERCSAVRSDNIALICETKSLIIQCLLEMNSINAIYELKRIRSRKDNNHEKYCNKFYYLIYLKISKMYINTQKYRTAKFFAKTCCYYKGTFNSYKFLGYAALKCQELNLAEQCFQIVYKINSFNSISWANLAIIYFRKNRIPQFRICAKNAKKQTTLDKKLLEKIERIEEILSMI